MGCKRVRQARNRLRDAHTNRKELEMKKLGRLIVLGAAAAFILAAAEGFNREGRCEEHPKADTSVVETPKVDLPKAEQPSIEQPKVEQPKAEQPQAEQPKAEHPKAEHPK